MKRVRRVVVRRPGGHGALELVEEPAPEPGPGQVRIRVRAAGVNYADCLVRMGLYEAAKGSYPITPGFEFAGEVETGSGRWRIGDRVLGVVRFGAYASRVVADEDRLWPCPEGWDLAQCAAFPAVFLTAYYGLFRAAKVERGQTVLVHSAAGGAGGALVRLAVLSGCRVVGTVGSAAKVSAARELGAEPVLTREGDFWERARRAAPGGYDAVFDANGVATLREGFRQLAPGGRLVVYGFAEILPRGRPRPGWLALARNWLRVPRFSPLEMTAANRGVVGFNVVHLFDRADLLGKAMADLLGWVREGRLGPPPVATRPLERAAEAHAALESGTTTGKWVLTA